MTITIARTGDDFTVNAANLPAPLVLPLEVARDFAAALIDPEMSTPAWKTDKLVWAPVTREPIGVWVSQSGQPSIWLAGQAEDISIEDAKALAEVVLLACTKFKVGDEVLTKTAVNGEKETIRSGSIAIVVKVSPYSGQTLYDVELDGNVAKGCDENRFEPAPPIQTFEVDDTGIQYFSRKVRVQARTTNQARQLAKPLIQALPATAWAPTARVESSNDYDVAPVDEAADTARRDSEGWFIYKGVDIRAIKGDPTFKNDEAALRFVIAQSVAGSAFHTEALRSIVV